MNRSLHGEDQSRGAWKVAESKSNFSCPKVQKIPLMISCNIRMFKLTAKVRLGFSCLKGVAQRYAVELNPHRLDGKLTYHDLHSFRNATIGRQGNRRLSRRHRSRLLAMSNLF